MEVLEEDELAMIRAQNEDYLAIRNAEFIEAQRFEAKEERVAVEISRRGIQQKARKAERVFAHMKHVARVISKSWLTDLRQNTL